MNRTIAIVATLDTKGVEVNYLNDLIRAKGCDTLVVDVGVFPQSKMVPHVSNEEIAMAGGSSVSEVLAREDRRFAIQVMREGGSKLLPRLHAQGRFSAVITIAGGTGTHIAAGIMNRLPLGVPKLLVSTVASRDMSGVIGYQDITVMHAISDFIGLNFVTKKILADAAGSIVGMLDSVLDPPQSRRVVALTSFGPLNPCAVCAQSALEALGYEVIPFHAIGSGTMAMEGLIDQGLVHGVLDLALHEFADHLHDGYAKFIGPERLESAGRKGIPHVIMPGGLDMIVFECTTVEGVPERLRHRTFHTHDFRSFVRTDADDLITLARLISGKLNRSPHPATVIIPNKGWSKADSAGDSFYQPHTNQVFTSELRSQVGSRVKIVEIEANINDEVCAETAVSELHRLMTERYAS